MVSITPVVVALNRRMYRPWGFYETLHLGDRHRIRVEPQGCLSLSAITIAPNIGSW